MTTRAILFDFGGTLDADGVPWGVRFHAAYRAAGGTVPFDVFEPVFKDSDRALAADEDVTSLGFRDMVCRQTALLLASLPDGGRVSSARVAGAFSQAAERITERNRALLEDLGRRFTLGVVSNFTGNLESCLAELGLRRYFTVVTDSAICGVSKPSAAIFERTLDALGVQPAEAWMVGDNFSADIVPAHALGLATCWIAPADRPLPAGPNPTRRIDTLPNFEATAG